MIYTRQAVRGQPGSICFDSAARGGSRTSRSAPTGAARHDVPIRCGARLTTATERGRRDGTTLRSPYTGAITESVRRACQLKQRTLARCDVASDSSASSHEWRRVRDPDDVATLEHRVERGWASLGRQLLPSSRDAVASRRQTRELRLADSVSLGSCETDSSGAFNRSPPAQSLVDHEGFPFRDNTGWRSDATP